MKPCVDPITGLRMKPSALQALTMLREQSYVTTREFGLTVGFRFGARLLELRALRFVIDERALGGGVAGSTYTLVAEPESDGGLGQVPSGQTSSAEALSLATLGALTSKAAEIPTPETAADGKREPELACNEHPECQLQLSLLEAA